MLLVAWCGQNLNLNAGPFVQMTHGAQWINDCTVSGRNEQINNIHWIFAGEKRIILLHWFMVLFHQQYNMDGLNCIGLTPNQTEPTPSSTMQTMVFTRDYYYVLLCFWNNYISRANGCEMVGWFGAFVCFHFLFRSPTSARSRWYTLRNNTPQSLWYDIWTYENVCIIRRANHA